MGSWAVAAAMVICSLTALATLGKIAGRRGRAWPGNGTCPPLSGGLLSCALLQAVRPAEARSRPTRRANLTPCLLVPPGGIGCHAISGRLSCGWEDVCFFFFWGGGMHILGKQSGIPEPRRLFQPWQEWKSEVPLRTSLAAGIRSLVGDFFSLRDPVCESV